MARADSILASASRFSRAILALALVIRVPPIAAAYRSVMFRAVKFALS